MAKQLLAEIDRKRIGDRLAMVRRIVDKTQDDFARGAGISRAAYNQYENGAKMPSIEAATMLCIAYDLTLDYIFHNEISGLSGRMIDAIKALRAADARD